MLRRQRTILRLLSAADGPLPATKLQKFAFLTRQETFLRTDRAFYDFVPYKFGPYSFAAQRELEALVAYGYVESAASSWCITETGMAEARTLDGDTARAVLSIISTYGKVSLSGLLKDVYARYPWYACNSDLQDLVPVGIAGRRLAPLAVYTAGYEDCSIDSFLNMLMGSGIARIIDVRSNPISRKFGFARSTLASLAGKVGLAYSHFPDLGISSERRRNLRAPSEFQDLFGHYERQILPKKAGEIAKVAELIDTAPSVLVCMEKEALNCHRSRLAARVASLGHLQVVHLQHA